MKMARLVPRRHLWMVVYANVCCLAGSCRKKLRTSCTSSKATMVPSQRLRRRSVLPSTMLSKDSSAIESVRSGTTDTLCINLASRARLFEPCPENTRHIPRARSVPVHEDRRTKDGLWRRVWKCCQDAQQGQRFTGTHLVVQQVPKLLVATATCDAIGHRLLPLVQNETVCTGSHRIIYKIPLKGVIFFWTHRKHIAV